MPTRASRVSSCLTAAMTFARASVLGTFAALSIATAAGLAPEPDPVPRRWQIDVEVGPMRLARVEGPNNEARLYWYLTYKAVNPTREDLIFAPAFDLVAEDGTTYRAGREVPPVVTRRLLDKLDNPLLQDQVQIIGTILQGQENAKEGLVIWPASQLASGEMVVYASGFSGETRTIEVADVNNPGKMTRATLRKTMMVRYPMRGDVHNQGDKPLEVGESRWIMR